MLIISKCKECLALFRLFPSASLLVAHLGLIRLGLVRVRVRARLGLGVWVRVRVRI